MSTPIITVDRVSKHYTGPSGAPLPVLSEVSLELREGEIVALLGRSGSGKSTLLRIMAGLIAPTSGSARLHGEPVTAPHPSAAMVFQNFALLPWLTVRQNIELGRIKGEIRVPLDPPRDPRAAGFQALTDRAYRLLVEGGHRTRDRDAA